MYNILRPGQKPQLASERSPEQVAEMVNPTIITRDGRYELVRLHAVKRGKPDAFHWVDSKTRASVSPMDSLLAAVKFAYRSGWIPWAGTADEAKSLIQQWKVAA